MHALKFSGTLGKTLVLAFALAGAACQPGPAVNTNANTNAANANTNMSVTNANAAAPTTSTAAIETREPEQYKGTLVFSASADGKSQAVQLSIEVARSGDNRRYAFNNIPVIGQIIFLDRADKRYLILPTRKQYAELTPELTGFDVRSLTPGQMVAHLQRQQGVERVGEEQRDGRTVVKYRYASTARTGSQAGDVATESFIYVDQVTGLPLHGELTGQSSGNVQGVNRARVVFDMKDIQTTVEPTFFEVPQDMTKLTEEQIKQQMSAVAAFMQFVLGNLNAQMGGAMTGGTTTTTPPASGTVSPAASPTPSATPR